MDTFNHILPWLVIVIVDIMAFLVVVTLKENTEKRHYCGRCKDYDPKYHYCKRSLSMLNEFSQACEDFKDYKNEA